MNFGQALEALKRLIAELTVPIRNDEVTPELLKAWREKAKPFLGGPIIPLTIKC